MPGLVEEQRRAGAVVLVDEDDDLREVSVSNRWRPSPETLARHDEVIAAADGLVVTTAALAARYGPLARRMWMVPNFLPASVAAHRFHGRDSRVRVGWAGIVQTHRDDLEWLAPALPGIGDPVLSLVGDPMALRVLRWRGRREVFGFQSTAEGLYKLMARADVGMVPLVRCPFNEAKSWLKALEYMALGIPVVVADLPEQRRAVVDGECGFVVGGPVDFAERVAQLAADADLREAMGRSARARAAQLTIEGNGDLWETALLQAAMVPA